mmetsp:Transcript_29928/g.58505  ORF Transcript_29928/g.58505 Transcript_29928/m.58505 type:complete len:319 (+) Transcript_29928:498-1454(+)
MLMRRPPSFALPPRAKSRRGTVILWAVRSPPPPPTPPRKLVAKAVALWVLGLLEVRDWTAALGAPPLGGEGGSLMAWSRCSMKIKLLDFVRQLITVVSVILNFLTWSHMMRHILAAVLPEVSRWRNQSSISSVSCIAGSRNFTPVLQMGRAHVSVSSLASMIAAIMPRRHLLWDLRSDLLASWKLSLAFSGDRNILHIPSLHLADATCTLVSKCLRLFNWSSGAAAPQMLHDALVACRRLLLAREAGRICVSGSGRLPPVPVTVGPLTSGTMCSTGGSRRDLASIPIPAPWRVSRVVEVRGRGESERRGFESVLASPP